MGVDMNALNFVIVSESIVLREGIFAFLRDNSYSPFCITKLSQIDQLDRSSLDGRVVILDDANLSSDEVIEILLRYLKPASKLKIVILSLCLDTKYIEQVVQYPHTGFVYRGDIEQYMLGVVHMLNQNMMSISPTALNRYLTARQIIEYGGINEDDLAVLHFLAEGCSVEDMVDELNVSKRKVYRILDKWREVLDVPISHLIVDRAR